ncbi:MAG TPA: SPFH domain-containing protein, partial [Planctomycetota bacterium]|nr:SPFH domain-containing protein [Planctomycetota bacterium]
MFLLANEWWMSPLGLTVLGAAAVAVVIFSTIMVFVKSWKKASAEMAFVRTGRGGEKVVISGGSLVFGFLHNIRMISLETMQLEVARKGEQALITKDKYRVDLEVVFHIRVEPVEERVSNAARSLGDKALSANSVKDLVEGKLVGALRSVAATRDLMELHQKRDEFADAVHEALKGELMKNGLTLETVSIVHLDQTDRKFYNPTNVFDAVGLRMITEQTELRRKERNEIERMTQVAVKERDVSAEVEIKKREVDGTKLSLDLEKAREIAASTQSREVEIFKADQSRQTMEQKISMEEQVSKRKIAKDQAVQEAQIQTDLRIQSESIERDRAVQQAAIEKDIVLVQKAQEKEAAELAKETFLAAKRQEKSQAEVAAELAVERAKRDKMIGILQKEQEREKKEAERLATVAERARAEANVLTVQKTAEAEREKAIAIIQQQAASEQERIQKQIAADAAAYEVQRAAEAKAKAAELDAQAIERLAQAQLAQAQAEAAGVRAHVEARNAVASNVLVQ